MAGREAIRAQLRKLVYKDMNALLGRDWVAIVRAASVVYGQVVEARKLQIFKLLELSIELMYTHMLPVGGWKVLHYALLTCAALYWRERLRNDPNLDVAKRPIAELPWATLLNALACMQRDLKLAGPAALHEQNMEEEFALIKSALRLTGCALVSPLPRLRLWVHLRAGVRARKPFIPTVSLPPPVLTPCMHRSHVQMVRRCCAWLSPSIVSAWRWGGACRVARCQSRRS